MRTKRMLVGAAGAAVAIAGGSALVAGGVANGATSSNADQAAASAAAPRARALLRHLEHGQLTLSTKKGDQTVDLQRGNVRSVSPTSLTVVSRDGFTATYTVGARTKVRHDGNKATIGDVHTGDTVVVVGEHGTALRVRDGAKAATQG